ncbi:hypothetical protein PENSPDRAFT_649363 [Peniophora sp. CONT]|nr:hypothetical protein PENSPDRAFT_649363 [Peniophora sp. CONT]
MDSSFLEELRSDPSGTVSLLRESLSNVDQGDSAPGHDTPHISECFYEVLRRPEATKDLIGTSAWSMVLAAGLPDVYVDTVASQDFFDRPLNIVSAVLSGFAGLCDKLATDAKAKSTTRSLMNRAVPLWSSIWTRCCADMERISEPQYKQKLILPLIELLYRFSGCYVVVHGQPPKKSFMPALGLLLYVLLDEDTSPQTLVFSLRCLSLCAKIDRPYGIHDAGDTGRAILPTNVTTLIGARKIVLRFKKTLSDPHALDYHSTYTCLLAVWAVAASPDIRPYVDMHGLFEGVNRAMSHLDSTHPDTEDRLRIWDLAQDIIRLLHSKRLTLGTPYCFAYSESVRGEDITDHFARGVRLAAEMNGDVIFDGHLDPTGRLYEAISDHIGLIHHLPHVPPAERANPVYAGPARLVEGMRTRAREVWWTSLCSLQAVEYRRPWETDPPRTEFGSIIDIWKSYGNRLGLREDVEQKRHQRDARHHCAWPGCPLYVEGSQEGLRACTGCGVSCYCSQDCQTEDWKRHKKECKRLKAASS